MWYGEAFMDFKPHGGEIGEGEGVLSLEGT